MMLKQAQEGQKACKFSNLWPSTSYYLSHAMPGFSEVITPLIKVRKFEPETFQEEKVTGLERGRSEI